MRALFRTLVIATALVALLAGGSRPGAHAGGLPKTIPGLTVGEVTAKLRPAGLRCRTVRRPRFWQCLNVSQARARTARILVSVSFVGSAPSRLLVVSAAVRARSGSVRRPAVRYLGLLAGALTYKNARPAKARRWVQARARRSSGRWTTTIGGVRFNMIAAGRTRSLHVLPAG